MTKTLLCALAGITMISGCGATEADAVYEMKVISGTPNTLTVTYNKNNTIVQEEVQAPWTKKFTADIGQMASLDVTVLELDAEPYEVSIVIKSDGEVVDKATATGDGVSSASTSGQF